MTQTKDERIMEAKRRRGIQRARRSNSGGWGGNPRQWGIKFEQRCRERNRKLVEWAKSLGCHQAVEDFRREARHGRV